MIASYTSCVVGGLDGFVRAGKGRPERWTGATSWFNWKAIVVEESKEGRPPCTWLRPIAYPVTWWRTGLHTFVDRFQRPCSGSGQAAGQWRQSPGHMRSAVGAINAATIIAVRLERRASMWSQRRVVAYSLNGWNRSKAEAKNAGREGGTDT